MSSCALTATGKHNKKMARAFRQQEAAMGYRFFISGFFKNAGAFYGVQNIRKNKCSED
jgi:hypothetical protein